jgi:hypothetical protein
MSSGAFCWRTEQQPKPACAIMLRKSRTPISAALSQPQPRVSNRQTELIETRLSRRKQSIETRSNRQIFDLLEIRSACAKLESIQTGEFISA